MESPTIRQRATLSDQLSSVNLRDLLKFRDDAVNVRQNRTTLTLASILEAEKHATATGGGRTLLDVIQEEDSASAATAAASSRWHELRDRIRFRPSATRTAGSGSESRVSLMALMELREREEEMDGADADVAVMSVGEVDADVAAAAAEEEEEEVEEKMAGREVEKHVCCVCMVRKKGAAFIPCGHTFCRACGRELFVGRGCCPLCNADIAEVLHIF